MVAKKGIQISARIEYRWLSGRPDPQVVTYEVNKVVRTTNGGRRGKFLIKTVEQPIEIGVGVNRHPLARAQAGVAADQCFCVGRHWGAVVADPFCSLRIRDQLIERSLEFGKNQVHSSVPDPSPPSADSHRRHASSAAAAKTSNSGILSSHSISVGTRPNRRTACS